MELSKDDNIILETLGEYAVVSFGAVKGIKVAELCVEPPVPLDPGSIAEARAEADKMPISVTMEELPFEISSSLAAVALCGIKRAGQGGSVQAREQRTRIGRNLEKLLKN